MNICRVDLYVVSFDVSSRVASLSLTPLIDIIVS